MFSRLRRRVEKDGERKNKVPSIDGVCAAFMHNLISIPEFASTTVQA